MKVQDLVEKFDVELVAGKEAIDKEVKSGYVGDLLSVVMGTAEEESVWVTIQGHINIIAVASLANISCIVVTQGYDVDEDTIKKANEEAIPIIKTVKSSYEFVKDLIALGL